MKRFLLAILCGLGCHKVLDLDNGNVRCVHCGDVFDPMDFYH